MPAKVVEKNIDFDNDDDDDDDDDDSSEEEVISQNFQSFLALRDFFTLSLVIQTWNSAKFLL